MRLLRRIAVTAGIGWIAWRLFGPDLPPPYRGPQERPLRLPGRTVLVGRKEFFVREIGPEDGPVIVLVHGWSFDGEMTYFRLVPLLADRFRLVIPDMRNHGKSDKIGGRFEIEDVADELAAVLDAIGIRRATAIVGYSMGGMVAQAFLRRHPGRCDRLVLGATAAYAIPKRRPLTWVALVIARAVARLSKKESALLTHRYLVRSGILDPRHSRWMWERLIDRDPTLFYESGFAVWRFDSREWVAGLGVPTLVLIPSVDRMVAGDAQRELASLIPDATVVEIEGTGHEAILSHADHVAAALVRFIGEEERRE